MEIPRHWRLKMQRIGFKNLKENPVLKANGIKNAIETATKKQGEELKDIQQKIAVYEANGCVAEKLGDTI